MPEDHPWRILLEVASSPTTAKRPLLVWVILAFYLFSAAAWFVKSGRGLSPPRSAALLAAPANSIPEQLQQSQRSSVPPQDGLGRGEECIRSGRYRSFTRHARGVDEEHSRQKRDQRVSGATTIACPWSVRPTEIRVACPVRGIIRISSA